MELRRVVFIRFHSLGLLHARDRTRVLFIQVEAFESLQVKLK
jgi:hypothetical protein